MGQSISSSTSQPSSHPSQTDTSLLRDLSGVGGGVFNDSHCREIWAALQLLENDKNSISGFNTNLSNNNENDNDNDDTTNIEGTATEQKIDFGLRSMGTVTEQTIEIENVGLLVCHYEIAMQHSSSNSSHFYIRDSSHGIHRGVLEGKASTQITVVYDLTQHIGGGSSTTATSSNSTTRSNTSTPPSNDANHNEDKKEFEGVVLLRWSKVQGGPVIVDASTTVHGGVGYVDVRLEKQSIDYGTMFVNQWKTKRLQFTNYGNTPTVVHARVSKAHQTGKGALVEISPTTENLDPNESMHLEIRVKALTVELLRTQVVLEVEGHTELLHIAIVGTVAAPHLIVPVMDFDYGNKHCL